MKMQTTSEKNRRYFWLITTILICLLFLAPAKPAQALNEPLIVFSLTLTPQQVNLNTSVDLIIEANNQGTTDAIDYATQLYLSEGLSLASQPGTYELYTPALTHTFTASAGNAQTISLSLQISSQAMEREGVALLHNDRVVARLDVPVIGGQFTPESDYNMPVPPTVNCGPVPPLSYIGGAVLQEVAGPNLSEHTWCNEVEGDWIIDVEDVTTVAPNPPPTTAEDFYTDVAHLIEDTEYTFSMSTLSFSTHDETGVYNLVRYYLAPAIRNLHDSIPSGGQKPLLRFIFAKSIVWDDIADVMEDLTANMPIGTPWRVNIAVATVGDAPIPLSPWNHAKIAVSDYHYAIVGGMNWDLDYVLPVDHDANGIRPGWIQWEGRPPYIPAGLTKVDRLYDLSMEVEGDAARAAGVYFDKLWRRTIDPIFPHLSNDCKTSWKWWVIINGIPVPHNDCPLDALPTYVVPDYTVNDQHNIFSLGRGHTEWDAVNDLDFTADEALFAAFDEAEETIYISQHKLTLFKGQYNPVTGAYYDSFSDEFKKRLIDAILRGVRIKVALSEPWGAGTSDDVKFVYNAFIEELFDEAKEEYGWGTGTQQLQVYQALCRFEVGPYSLPRYDWNYPILYHTHNKFIMVDERAFYVGSQNLYPSGIKATLIELDPGVLPDLNEYGFFVDDVALANQMLAQYWQPIWGETWLWAEVLYEPEPMEANWKCLNGQPHHYTAVELVDWQAKGNGSGEILVTWETAMEFNTERFNIYRHTVDDFSTATLVHQEPAVGYEFGAEYEWIDADVYDGLFYYYWLEEEETTGIREHWGPITTTTALPDLLDLAVTSVAIPDRTSNQIYVTVANLGTVRAENFAVGIDVSNLTSENAIQDYFCISSLDPEESITVMLEAHTPYDDNLILAWVDNLSILSPSSSAECLEAIQTPQAPYENDFLFFTSSPGCPPALAFPDNGNVLNSQSPPLLWGQCAGLNTYDLEIRRLATNDVWQVTELPTTFYALTQDETGPDFLIGREQYEWRIKACSVTTEICSDWSAPRYFWWEKAAPEIVAMYATSLVYAETPDVPWEIKIQARDGDNASLIWSLENLGGTNLDGVVFQSAGHWATISWIPNESQGPSINQMRITVSDGIDTVERILTLEVQETNTAPTLQPLTDQVVHIWQTLSFTAIGDDPDIPINALTYHLIGNIPEGMILNPVSGELSWQPVWGQQGDYIVTIQVSDGQLTNQKMVSITVKSP